MNASSFSSIESKSTPKKKEDQLSRSQEVEVFCRREIAHPVIEAKEKEVRGGALSGGVLCEKGKLGGGS